MTQHEQATLAIRAARHRKQWGRYAASQFIRKHDVPFALYRLACQLEAIHQWENDHAR